jgi:hypothetical protein
LDSVRDCLTDDEIDREMMSLLVTYTMKLDLPGMPEDVQLSTLEEDDMRRIINSAMGVSGGDGKDEW